MHVLTALTFGLWKPKPSKLGPLQRKWIKSLRAHPKRQMTGMLGIGTPDNYKACCLGEGGLIAGVCKFKNGQIVSIDPEDPSRLNLFSLYQFEALGLASPHGRSVDLNNIDTLATLNDEGKTWSEIANLLESHPEKYFIKKV